MFTGPGYIISRIVHVYLYLALTHMCILCYFKIIAVLINWSITFPFPDLFDVAQGVYS